MESKPISKRKTQTKKYSKSNQEVKTKPEQEITQKEPKKISSIWKYFDDVKGFPWIKQCKICGDFAAYVSVSENGFCLLIK